jgi:hypothetical protein
VFLGKNNEKRKAEKGRKLTEKGRKSEDKEKLPQKGRK